MFQKFTETVETYRKHLSKKGNDNKIKIKILTETKCQKNSFLRENYFPRNFNLLFCFILNKEAMSLY